MLDHMKMYLRELVIEYTCLCACKHTCTCVNVHVFMLHEFKMTPNMRKFVHACVHACLCVYACMRACMHAS